MVLIRALGWLMLTLAVAAIVQDGLNWWSEGVFRLLALGDLWSRLDYDSFNSTESFLKEHVADALPVLAVPALPVFLVLGGILLWLGRGSFRRGEPRGISSSPPPRRRRRARSGLS
jgi:hypothetical protein